MGRLIRPFVNTAERIHPGSSPSTSTALRLEIHSPQISRRISDSVYRTYVLLFPSRASLADHCARRSSCCFPVSDSYLLFLPLFSSCLLPTLLYLIPTEIHH